MIAEITIKVPKWELIIHKMIVWQKVNSKWITFPALSYQVDGVTKYAPILKFATGELQKRFSEAVLKSVDEYQVNHGLQ
jgi:hypothetical protein